MPKLAAFPKAFLDPLCVDGTMSIRQWIDLAATLEVDGLEFYAGFLELHDQGSWAGHRNIAADHGLPICMLCCSPDFTHPDPKYRREQVEQQKRWIELASGLGAGFCRVLSGQRRPELSREEGINYAVECIEACLPYAAERAVVLIIENHYKDPYWQYSEFAQKMDIFCDLIARIHSPNFGVNFDPSNTLIAGEDPIELLRRVKRRVVTMHASDRYLTEGTLEDLLSGGDTSGYSKRLHHGEIGKGLNDYDHIFSELAGVGFDGWISIEDGMDGMEQLRRSADFLRRKINQHWPRGRG